MSEKFENNELNEQNLEQVAGGLEVEWEAMPTFIYSCMKCGATKYITAKTCPSAAPICCGIPMDLEGV